MKLLQIDSCLGIGSTGRITESIARMVQSRGGECYIVHGARFVKHPSCMTDIQSVSKMGEYLHFLSSLLLDNHGLLSRKATDIVVEHIKSIKPDIIHLHCIHGYYLNYRVLFNYLNTTDIPIVWTFHDCWAFTGHCAHFTTIGCDRWKTGCDDCPNRWSYPKSIVDCSRRNYEIKKSSFSANKNLHIVPVSEWLADLTRQSFLNEKDIRVIRNGVDISVFKPSEKHDSSTKFRVLGVSGVWTKSKGIDDFYRLREMLDKDKFDIVLVGLNSRQMKKLPNGIIGIEHTESVQELASIYSSADIFFNPTYADTFPTVNIEALACGTPVLTYRTGGSPEAVSSSTGWVVGQGDIESVSTIIRKEQLKKKSEQAIRRSACRERAINEFDKNKCFEDYVGMYEELIR